MGRLDICQSFNGIIINFNVFLLDFMIYFIEFHQNF